MEGEIGIEKDTGKFKIGRKSANSTEGKNWSELPYENPYESGAGENSAVLKGGGNIAVSKGGHAEGQTTAAGSKAFNILEYKPPVENVFIGGYVLDSVEGIEIGDIYSLKIENNYLNNGTVINIDIKTNVVEIENCPTEELVLDEATGSVIVGEKANSFRLDNKPNIGTKDFGTNSHAEGRDTKALGDFAHTEGYGTVALGRYSHAEGNQTKAYHGAHSEGEYTKAIGNDSHAEGHTTTASGFSAHAEGNQTEASGNISHAEGYKTKAINSQAHSEGQSTTAEGVATHAEGFDTHAKGDYSHAEGQTTDASGTASHAEGYNTRSIGVYSHSEGYQTVALGAEAHAEGRSEELTDKTTSAEIESAWLNGTTPKNFSAAVGMASHVEGTNNVVLSNYGHAEGLKNIVKADGSQAHVEGYDNVVSHGGAHVEGLRNISCGNWSHVQGQYNAPGNFAHVVGGGTGIAENQRKNIHTIDWYGNAEFAGTVTSKDGELAAKNYVDESKKTLIGGAPETLDTLKEITDFLGTPDSENSVTIIGKINDVDKKLTTSKLDANGWITNDEKDGWSVVSNDIHTKINPTRISFDSYLTDKSSHINNEEFELYEQHGNLHQVIFTSKGFTTRQVDSYYGNEEELPEFISVSYPTQNGRLVVDAELDKFAIKDDVIKDLATKLDANRWGVIPKNEV
jgi:hypothetical protein